MTNASENCLFCKIVSGEIPATRVYENAEVVAFRDINPGAPVHVLIVPRQHIDNAHMLDAESSSVMAHMILAAQKVARDEKVDDSGYRLVMNNGADAGQSVNHLHMHLLGGRKLTWPPG